MMKQIFIFLLIVWVQFINGSEVEPSGTNHAIIHKKGDSVYVELHIDPVQYSLSSQQMVTLYPCVSSYDTTHEIINNGIIFAGNKRFRVVRRETFYNEFHPEHPVDEILRIAEVKKKGPEVVTLNMSLPYQSWMRDAKLTLKEITSGCCDVRTRETSVAEPFLPPAYIPEFALAYLYPEVEEIKQRKETYSAHLTFKVNDYKLLQNFGNNEEVLREIDSVISEIKNDSNLIITGIAVTGYASPEGNFNSNLKLSENRARSFVSYLSSRFDFKGTQLSVNWKGEDWDGLYEAVENSSLPDKDAILSIINNEADINKRKSKLKQLSGGSVYAQLLKEYYPALRRNDYTINYIARPFNLEEARILIYSKPHHLSLNEIFIVATSYPKNSNEYKEAFEIAAKIYPDSPVAKFNAATLGIENGTIDDESNILETFDSPDAWNNLGITNFYRGEYDNAGNYFNRAAETGHKEGQSNLEQFMRWKADQ